MIITLLCGNWIPLASRLQYSEKCTVFHLLSPPPAPHEVFLSWQICIRLTSEGVKAIQTGFIHLMTMPLPSDLRDIGDVPVFLAYGLFFFKI